MNDIECLNDVIGLIWFVCADGMGTAEWRAAKSPAYYKRGDYVPGLKVNGYIIVSFG